MGEKPVVLVVDDDKDISSIIKMGLERSGYEVHGFNDPAEALSHIEQGCKGCEILVTDIKMPNMTGFELVRRIRGLHPQIKVVIMTAFEINLSELDIVLPGLHPDNVIRKPFMPSQLLEIIKPLYAS